MQTNEELLEALSDIVHGRTVKRAKHELIFEGNDITTTFIETLVRHHYLPSTVDRITIQPGERVPAFFIENNIAYFGWIIWEKFSRLRLRKLFGTVVRNAKGDWLIQLPSNSPKTVYADTSQTFEMDIDRPVEL